MVIMKNEQSTWMCADIIPYYAHNVIVFMTASLYMQDTIYTKISKQNTEQWIELVVRFYIHDTHLIEKQNTFRLLKKLKHKVHEMMLCAFQFEQLLHCSKTDKMKKNQQKLEQDWKLLYEQMLKNTKQQSKRKKGKQTKKKSFA